MSFAFIGCKTEFYLSLHHHFLEKKDQLHFYRSVDLLLNETLIESFDALLIDYDSFPSSYNRKLVQCLKTIYPSIPIVFFFGKKVKTKDMFLPLKGIDFLKKELSMNDIILKIYHFSVKKRIDKTLYMDIGKDYIFDIHSLILYYKNTAQPLTDKEITFLLLLIRNPGKFMTIDEIAQEVYSDNATIKHVAIRSFIMRLRNKLNGEIIETYPRLGYRLKSLSKLNLAPKGIYDK